MCLPFVPETSFVGRLLRTIDIFLVTSSSPPPLTSACCIAAAHSHVATTLFVIYGIIALLIATVKTLSEDELTRNKKIMIGAGVAASLPRSPTPTSFRR